MEFQVVDLDVGGGRTLQRELVVHPGAVVILAQPSEREVVLIRNQRWQVGRTLWELPAGTLEPGEDPQLAAGRELEEEAGYRAGRMDKLGTFFSAPGISTEQMHAYRATELEQIGQRLEADEQIEVHAVPLEMARQMMLRGEIADAKTMATLSLHLLQERS